MDNCICLAPNRKRPFPLMRLDNRFPKLSQRLSPSIALCNVTGGKFRRGPNSLGLLPPLCLYERFPQYNKCIYTVILWSYAPDRRFGALPLLCFDECSAQLLYLFCATVTILDANRGFSP